VTKSKITTEWLRAHGITHSANVIRDLIDAGVITSPERHHVSKAANYVTYYRPKDISDQINACSELEIEDALERVRKGRDTEVVHHDCDVTWTDWELSEEKDWQGVVKDQTCTTHRAVHTTVRIKGVTARIALPDGSEVVKRTTSDGFLLVTSEKRQRAQLSAERDKEGARFGTSWKASISTRVGDLAKDFVFERKTPNGWEHVNPKKFAFKVCGTARHAERLLREMVEGDTVNVLGSAYRMTPR